MALSKHFTEGFDSIETNNSNENLVKIEDSLLAKLDLNKIAEYAQISVEEAEEITKSLLISDVNLINHIKQTASKLTKLIIEQEENPDFIKFLSNIFRKNKLDKEKTLLNKINQILQSEDDISFTEIYKKSKIAGFKQLETLTGEDLLKIELIMFLYYDEYETELERIGKLYRKYRDEYLGMNEKNLIIKTNENNKNTDTENALMKKTLKLKSKEYNVDKTIINDFLFQLKKENYENGKNFIQNIEEFYNIFINLDELYGKGKNIKNIQLKQYFLVINTSLIKLIKSFENILKELKNNKTTELINFNLNFLFQDIIKENLNQNSVEFIEKDFYPLNSIQISKLLINLYKGINIKNEKIIISEFQFIIHKIYAAYSYKNEKGTGSFLNFQYNNEIYSEINTLIKNIEEVNEISIQEINTLINKSSKKEIYTYVLFKKINKLLEINKNINEKLLKEYIIKYNQEINNFYHREITEKTLYQNISEIDKKYFPQLLEKNIYQKYSIEFNSNNYNQILLENMDFKNKS